MSKFYNILVIGVGGTGGLFANFLAKIMQGMDRKDYSIALADADRVEKKNLDRQPYFVEDIGESKAKVTARALEEGYGVTFRYYERYISTDKDIEMMLRDGMPKDRCYGLDVSCIIVGCVDNHAARKCMHDYFEKSDRGNILYIDSGNEYSFGEVVYSAKGGRTVHSPLKSFYFPDIFSGDMTSREEESCEALNSSAPQHFCTNLMAASIMISAVSAFMSGAKLMTGITSFDSGIADGDIRVSHHPYSERGSMADGAGEKKGKGRKKKQREAR